MTQRAIITETLDAGCADWLAQHTDLVWCAHDEHARLDELLPEAEALIVRTYTQVTGALLDKAPRLKVVARAGVGLDNIDLPACRQRNVQVVYTPDANTQAVVEYVFALILDTVRPRTDMPDAVSDKRFHELRKTQVGKQLTDLTLGILGFGRIGTRIAKAARGLSIPNVLVNDVLPEAELRSKVDFDVNLVDKATLYRESDVLTVHVDGRADNRHLIDAAALEQLKPNCLFINAARGMLIDHDALAAWAGSHPDARVILDVHDPEPPATDLPLYGQPNVRLLPHLASRTDTALKNMSWVVRDVVAVLNGEAPEYPAP
jgi:phosphoglycerate dehydrogenase-like enzyme